MKRRRISAAFGAFLALSSLARPVPYVPDLRPAAVRLSVNPVHLNADAPAMRRVGKLRFLAGWEIRSDDIRFGGVSALHVAGDRVTALSDTGAILRFALGQGGTAEVRPLVAGPGPAFSKRNRDSESMVLDGGRLWVAFERHNAVWRYDPATLAPHASAAPAAMRAWPKNDGAEAMARLRDGRFLILSEKVDDDGFSQGLLFGGDPAEEGTAVRRLRYRPPAGYRPTDAAQLPDGRILVLARRFSLLGGFSAKLAIAPLAPVMEGEEIAAFAPPVVTDNYEALAVTQENGRTILWMASDDNFSPLQRTILLKFALDG